MLHHSYDNSLFIFPNYDIVTVVLIYFQKKKKKKKTVVLISYI